MAKRMPYRLDNGTRVPGVTTVKGSCINPDPLIYWAYERGRQRLELYGEQDAEVGTICHDMVECFLEKRDFNAGVYNQDLVTRALRAYGEFDRWFTAQANIRFLQTEVRLVSSLYHYGGMLDAVAYVDGELMVLDWKTSKELYPDYKIQVAAYVALWNECWPDQPVNWSAHIVRFAKDGNEWNQFAIRDVRRYFDEFLMMRFIYERRKKTQDNELLGRLLSAIPKEWTYA